MGLVECWVGYSGWRMKMDKARNDQEFFQTSHGLIKPGGDVKVLHSRMTKTCRRKLVACLLNVGDKSQKAICTICWGYWITM